MVPIRHILAQQAHRPWPLPPGPWRWRQSWYDLLFAHWRCPAEWVRQWLPPQLEVDEYDGTSWIGAVPFFMHGVMRRPWPDIPGLSAFPELNLRLYVRHQDRPGVWFLSLDASNRWAVWGARTWFSLPYCHATMRVTHQAGWTEFTSVRREPNDRATFQGRYRPLAPLPSSQPGSLQYFLTERYCLYTTDRRGRLLRAEVHHLPWPLHSAEAEIASNQLGDQWHRPLTDPPDHLLYSPGVDTVVWSPIAVTSP